MPQSGHMVLKGINCVHNNKFSQMGLKEVSWVHNDKLGQMVLTGVNSIHNAKIRSYGLERSHLDTQ